ncbi:unnamed protein product [Rotaria sordida]|uniref:G-protein coupled receptors family 1 profile domain-containing protein n=1 Tax=Rotaria sordida TaxID=392033 RepID=A0A815BEM3_9BILA|nr:unnamed protein product [Rotaria sordida]
MPTSSSDENLFILLNNISNEINRYFSIFIFLFGVIGNILNIFVLSQRKLRSNPCAWLFLTSSIANLFAILSAITTRMLAGWTIDPTDTIGWLCKLRGFIIYSSRTAAYWLIVLAVIDRWLLSSTSVRHRQLATLKNAQRGAIIILIISSLLYAEIFYCYEANLINTPLPCYTKNTLCRYIIDISIFVMAILLPVLLMITFGLMTISNINRSHRRVHALAMFFVGNSTIEPSISLIGQQQNQQEAKQEKKVDRNLLKMLLIQVILLTLFILPLVLEKIYSMLIRPNKFPLEAAIDSLVYNIALLLCYLTNGIPFYIYTLFGRSVFRNVLLDLFRKIAQKLLTMEVQK